MGRLPNGKMLLFTEVFFTEWLNKKTKTKTKKTPLAFSSWVLREAIQNPRWDGLSLLSDGRLAQTRACPRDCTCSELTGHRPRSMPPPWEAGAGAVLCVRLEPPALMHLLPEPPVQARPLWSRCWVWPESSGRFSWPRPRAMSKQSTQGSGPGAMWTPGSGQHRQRLPSSQR